MSAATSESQNSDFRVYVYGNAPAELTEALTRAPVQVVDQPDGADFVVWNSFDTDELCDVLVPANRWVQLPSAGINHWGDAGVLDRERTWLSAAGAYSGPVAAHGVASYLAAIHRIPEFATATSWQRLQFRPLTERSAVILGLGGIGTEVARQLRALGISRVCGVVRNQREIPEVDEVMTLDDPRWHDGVDDIINVLPATSATRRIIDARVLASLPADGIVVNIGRGEAIVDDDALAALKNDALGGMVLDVTDPEPLPDDHPYWRDDRVVITGHSANPTDVATRDFVARALENVERAAAGRELLGVVDLDQGY